MIVHAKHLNAPVSPFKARLVVDLIRGLSVDKALENTFFYKKEKCFNYKKSFRVRNRKC